MPPLRALLALAALSACTHDLPSTLHSAVGETTYALRYPQLLAAARAKLAADEARAHELSVGLAKIQEIQLAETGLPRRIVDEAEAAGTSEEFAAARAIERDVVLVWSEERSGLAARASAAAQKELASGPCSDRDLGPPVQHALRDGLDRPLERRLRASNEAQRTLDIHKARLAPGTLPAWQRAADEIALARHQAFVTLPDDARALQQLLAQQSGIDATLRRAIDDERQVQAAPLAGEQKASQQRVIEVEKVRAGVGPEVALTREAAQRSEATVRTAQDEYEAALRTIRERLAVMPGPAPAASVTSPTRQVAH